MFYNVYLRAASGTKFSDLEGELLNYACKLHLLDAGAKFTFEPTLREMGDGTPHVTAESVSLECATLRVSAAEYDYLRDTHHNKLSDVLFLDPHDMSLVIGVYRMRLNVQLVAQSGDVCLINITGKIDAAATVIDTLRVDVFALDASAETYALIEGRVVDEDDLPIPGVYITTDAGGPVLTDYLGEFSIIADLYSTKLTALHDDYLFAPVALAIKPGQVHNITIQEVKE